MNLLPGSEEESVIDAVRSYMTGALPLTRLHAEGSAGMSAEVRSEMAELGWYSMALDEEWGGAGMTAVDEMLLLREVGRHVGPLGVLSINLAAKVAAAAGQTGLVERLAGGHLGVALVVSDANSTRARLLEVEGAALALAIEQGRATLFDLAGIDASAAPCLDKSTTMAFADLQQARVLAEADAAGILPGARLLAAAMQVGLAEAALDMIVDYAKIRETFGRPIGSYQAVRHPCADMAVRAEVARSQLFYAAVVLRDDRQDAVLHADVAKYLANDAAVINCDAAIQLHGGIATTDEHDMHLLMKRAQLMARLFGNKQLLDSILVAAPSA